jgi:hypothetical protein
VSERDLLLMRRIDELHLEAPYYGARKLAAQLRRWRLSNTLTSDFCVEALEEALAKFGSPEIFNTDQGSQFTSEEWLAPLKARRGAWLSVWMAKVAGSTTSLSNGCGGA